MADLPRRFFSAASVEETGSRCRVVLDGRPVRTPKGAHLEGLARELAHAIASEWNALDVQVDPRLLPLTRLANTAIDGVANAREAVLADLRRYGANDLLCYRAETPEGLAARQAAAWDRWLDWARAETGARLKVTTGIVHVTQPSEALDALGEAAGGYDAFGLTALHTATTLLGSVVLGLALARGALRAEEAWAAARVDETWQEERWGVDEEAARRAAALGAELAQCERFLRLAGS